MSECRTIINENAVAIIELTEKAIHKFNLAKETLTDKSKLALRINSSSRGWAGPRLDVFLDEKRYTNDKTVEINNIPIIYNLEIESIIGKVQIDYFQFLFMKGFEINKIN